jgi:hypothetical protein
LNSSNTAILVLGYARPTLLKLILESLIRQDAIELAHVWIDGTADRMEMPADVAVCGQLASSYRIAELRTHRGHLGIEKLMLDALSELVERYQRVIVLEDDCFPTRDAVSTFLKCLDRVADTPEIFSVYGHPFLTEAEAETIPRFQGWGWATTSAKLARILPEMKRLFSLPELEYLEFTRRCLTPDIIARLDVTPGRNVTQVLQRFFSWDSCTALLTALAGQVHLRTPHRVIFNCGLGGSSGHFPEAAHLRLPPFNMIRPDEAWSHF